MWLIGQSTLSSSFLSASRSVNQDAVAKPSKQPISLSEFLNRKVGKSSDRLLQEKQGPIGSFGFNKIDLDGKRSDVENRLLTKGGTLEQFGRALKRKDGVDVDDVAAVERVGVDGFKNELQCPRKRKKPSEFNAGMYLRSILGEEIVNMFEIIDEEEEIFKNIIEEALFSSTMTTKRNAARNPKHLVIVGDDPKPRPKRRKQLCIDKEDASIYNHYAGGHGYWDGDKEGIDYEVGNNEVWEGVGSTTLGGLDWH